MKSMVQLLNRTAAGLALLLLVGCQTPFERQAVNTIEWSTQIADGFTKYEYDNRAKLWEVNQEIKHTADFIRINYPTWNSNAWNVLDAYRAGKTNQDAVTRAVGIVQAVGNQAVDAYLTYEINKD